MFYIINETKTEPTTRVYPYHIHTMIAFLCPKCRWKLFDLVVRTMTIADKTSRKKIYSWRVFSVVFEKKALGIRFRQSCAGRKKNIQRNYTRMEANEERSKNVSCLRLLQYREIILSLFFIFVLPFLRVSLPWPSFSYLLINFDCQYRFLLSVTHKRFFFLCGVYRWLIYLLARSAHMETQTKAMGAKEEDKKTTTSIALKHSSVEKQSALYVFC